MDTEQHSSSNSLFESNWLFIIGIFLICLTATLILYLGNAESSQASASMNNTVKAVAPLPPPVLKYGLPVDSFSITNNTIKPNQFLSNLLADHKVDYAKIDELAKNTKSVFDVRNLRAGKDFSIFTKDTADGADYFVYEPSVYQYVVYDLKNASAEVFQRDIDTIVQTFSGVIESSMWNAMTGSGLSYELTSKMEDAFAWSVDFHHIQKGDRFKLIYEQKQIEGEPVGVGNILAAQFENMDNDHYAIYYESANHNGYFDLEARSMKKVFLKAPVKYSRISSGYNLRRFHPVLRRTRPHYGTDYAAPYGTPIYAVADGVVTKANYTKGNGRYVKIKHDEVYQTQYLHMQKFAKGITPGVHVKQGQTIGYVGSSGLATGPHVCFRFWKYGKQVNHRAMNLPPPDPMPEADKPAYFLVRDKYKKELDKISYPELIVGDVSAVTSES